MGEMVVERAQAAHTTNVTWLVRHCLSEYRRRGIVSTHRALQSKIREIVHV